MAANLEYPKARHEALSEAGERLEEHGLGRFQTMRGTCENCGGPLVGVRFTTERWQCPTCGESDKRSRIGLPGAIALGAAAGAGLIGLVWWLRSRNQEDEEPRSMFRMPRLPFPRKDSGSES
jgi:hypothetical protein